MGKFIGHVVEIKTHLLGDGREKTASVLVHGGMLMGSECELRQWWYKSWVILQANLY